VIRTGGMLDGMSVMDRLTTVCEEEEQHEQQMNRRPKCRPNAPTRASHGMPPAVRDSSLCPAALRTHKLETKPLGSTGHPAVATGHKGTGRLAPPAPPANALRPLGQPAASGPSRTQISKSLQISWEFGL
jgi:hypothetical protein